jgi:ferredoxin
MAARGEAMRNEVEEKLKRLKAKALALAMRSRNLRERAERLESTGRRNRYAVPDRSSCTGCGVCVQDCPQDAIHLAMAGTAPATEPGNA